MTSAALRAGLLFFLYATAYLALRLLPDGKYAGYFNTVIQAAADVACAVFAFAAARQAEAAWRGFFRAIAIASSALFVANFAWGFVINIFAIDPNTTVESLAYRIPYLLCLTFWTIAWLELVVRHVNRGASVALGVAALLVGGFLAFLLVDYYGPLIVGSAAANPHRVFVFLYVGLEIAALILSTGAAIIEIHPYPTVIAIGYCLLVAADFIFNTNELRDMVPQNSVVEIPWTLAQILVALGLKSQAAALAGGGAAADYSESRIGAQFAIPLLSVTLGAGLLGAVIARSVHPETVALGCYLFSCAVTAIGISALARAHSRALSKGLGQVARLADRGDVVTTHRWDEMLRLFGSGMVLDRVRSLLVRMRTRTMPSGSDPMFPTDEAWATEIPGQVFIAMPYTQPWSDDVAAWLRGVASKMEWLPVRDDDLYERRDIIASLWKGICDSQIVIADLTGRNPNVLYEVGLAHCLGKPVIFTSQNREDVPFDLYTRRVVFYDLRNLGAGTRDLERALAALSKVRSREGP